MSMFIVDGFCKCHHVALWRRENEVTQQPLSGARTGGGSILLRSRPFCFGGQHAACASCQWKLLPMLANGLSSYVCFLAMSLICITTCASWLPDQTLAVSESHSWTQAWHYLIWEGEQELKRKSGGRRNGGGGGQFYHLSTYLPVCHITEEKRQIKTIFHGREQREMLLSAPGWALLQSVRLLLGCLCYLYRVMIYAFMLHSAISWLLVPVGELHT